MTCKSYCGLISPQTGLSHLVLRVKRLHDSIQMIRQMSSNKSSKLDGDLDSFQVKYSTVYI